MVEFENVTAWWEPPCEVTYWVLPRSMLPKLKLVQPVGLWLKVRTSSLPVPVLFTLTVEPRAVWVVVRLSVQAEHTRLASICPENVIVIVSPESILPAVPVPFAATRELIDVFTLLSAKLAELAPVAAAEIV